MKVIFTTAPAEEAPILVKSLLKARLIGCANMLEGARSLYWWKGEIQDDTETIIFMETPDENTDEVMKMLYEVHPYDVPKIVVLNPHEVNQSYVTWLKAEANPS